MRYDFKFIFCWMITPDSAVNIGSFFQGIFRKWIVMSENFTFSIWLPYFRRCRKTLQSVQPTIRPPMKTIQRFVPVSNPPACQTYFDGIGICLVVTIFIRDKKKVRRCTDKYAVKTNSDGKIRFVTRCPSTIASSKFHGLQTNQEKDPFGHCTMNVETCLRMDVICVDRNASN